jgi:hypothetical protein
MYGVLMYTAAQQKERERFINEQGGLVKRIACHQAVVEAGLTDQVLSLSEIRPAFLRNT